MDEAVDQVKAYVSAMRAAGHADAAIAAELEKGGWTREQIQGLLGLTKRRATKGSTTFHVLGCIGIVLSAVGLLVAFLIAVWLLMAFLMGDR